MAFDEVGFFGLTIPTADLCLVTAYSPLTMPFFLIRQSLIPQSLLPQSPISLMP